MPLLKEKYNKNTTTQQQQQKISGSIQQSPSKTFLTEGQITMQEMTCENIGGGTQKQEKSVRDKYLK